MGAALLHVSAAHTPYPSHSWTSWDVRVGFGIRRLARDGPRVDARGLMGALVLE